jgi:hypothetical protein
MWYHRMKREKKKKQRVENCAALEEKNVEQEEQCESKVELEEGIRDGNS